MRIVKLEGKDNPRCTCVARVTVVAVSICLCVCLLSHISPLGLLFVVKTLPCTQWATKVKTFETVPLQRLNTPSHDGHTLGQPFFLQRTHMRIVHTQVLEFDHSRCDAPYTIAISSPWSQSLWGWRDLARVVCLPGYRIPHDISWTVVPLYS